MTTLIVLYILLLSTGAQAHDFFMGQSNSQGENCCNGKDCSMGVVRLNESDYSVEIYLEGRWWPAEHPLWFMGTSPDGSWYGCMLPSDQKPRCVWGGAGT